MITAHYKKKPFDEGACAASGNGRLTMERAPAWRDRQLSATVAAWFSGSLGGDRQVSWIIDGRLCPTLKSRGPEARRC